MSNLTQDELAELERMRERTRELRKSLDELLRQADRLEEALLDFDAKLLDRKYGR